MSSVGSPGAERGRSVLYAGIAWSARGFDLSFRNATGAAGPPPLHFPAGHLGELRARLGDLGERLGDDLVCVVDSTNGMVDGGLMAAGLRVVRADPWTLPARPGFGSVDADTLARAAAQGRVGPAALSLSEGSLTGRSQDHAAAERDSEATLARLTEEQRCVVRGPQLTDRPRVALTFDDGPNPPWTGRILDVLDRYDVRATFFCVGLHASGHREELARMAEAGHDVGNHTWSHPFLPDLSPAEVEVQLERTDEALAPLAESRAGSTSRRWFRPPYGSGTPEVYARLASDPTRTVVLWDVDTEDWAMPGAPAITSTILERTRPGSIVLMHDGGGDRSQTVDALPAAIEGLLDRGCELVGMQDLLAPGGVDASP